MCCAQIAVSTRLSYEVLAAGFPWHVEFAFCAFGREVCFSYLTLPFPLGEMHALRHGFRKKHGELCLLLHQTWVLAEQVAPVTRPVIIVNSMVSATLELPTNRWYASVNGRVVLTILARKFWLTFDSKRQSKSGIWNGQHLYVNDHQQTNLTKFLLFFMYFCQFVQSSKRLFPFRRYEKSQQSNTLLIVSFPFLQKQFCWLLVFLMFSFCFKQSIMGSALVELRVKEISDLTV